MINLNVINVDELLEKASRSGITVLLENGKLVMEADEDRDIDETIIEEIKEYKRIIIDHLRNKKVTDSLTATIAPVKRDGEAIPLSFSQERLWFIDKLEGSVHYHIPTVLKFRGVLDSTALEQAFREVVNRHEVLRTVMREEDGQAWQHFLEKDSWHLSAIDESAGREEAIHTLLHAPFDLSQDHMLRAALLNDGPSAYLLVMVMHHIASDGWSGNVLVRELVELYSAYATQRLPDLQPLPVQYADYAVWQRSYMSGEVLHKLERYWEQQLAGVEPLNLPLDYPRPAVQSTRGAMHHMVIDAGLTADLHRFSQEQNATLFMTLLSVYKVLLYRYSGQEVICVGTPIAGRRRRETEDLIGFFANTLALRSDLSNDQPFTALLQQVKDTLLGGYDHQDIPFEKVVDVAARDRDRSRHPLFQVMFVLQNIPEMTAATLGDTTISMVAPENKTAKFELTFTITEEKKRLQLDIEYCTDLFNAATIARMAAHYEQLLKSVVAAPSQLTGSLPMITPAEEKQLLQDFPGVRVNYPQHTTILDLIEKQVAERPDAIAVTYENESLTYGELDRKATQLGHYLRSHGVQEETLVPLCIDRGTDMIVGILGIMKAGGAYVPMDPAYPEDRIRYMLEDTKATVVVSNSRCSAVCNYSAARMIELDTDQEIIRQQPVINPDIQRSPQHVAYVIYTSGSTGRPKGVLIEHYNVVRLFETDIMLYDFNESDVWTMFHSFCFDFSVWEMYGALFYGGRLVVVPKQVTIDSSLFGQLLLEEQVTVLNQTPSSFYVLQDYMVSHADAVPVRYVIFGGEALNPVRIKAWKQHYPACRLINMYGITETTVHVTFQEMLPVHLEHPASVIGHTIPTLYAYILNNNRTPVPVGVSGELYISGAGLARGYLNLPALTAERFIPSPFIAGERLYKTGDLARWLPDGNLEYLGRIDDQVKIRGFRIELGEIESVLQKSNLVQSCVIIAKTDKTGNKQLVGYVVPKAEFNKEALQSWLREHLPEYMVPAAWVPLEKIPLTVNGKVDRKALPDPEDVIVNTTAYVAPRNETEQQLAAIWEELLGIQQAGIYDNFFERGGDSIRVIKVVSRVKQAFGRNLKVFDVYQSATIADLAALLEKAAVSGNTEDNLHAAIGAEIAGIREEVMPQLENAALIEDVYPMSDIEQGMVYSSVLNPDEALYHDQFVYNIPAAFSAEIVREAFAAIVSRHSILRTAFRLNTAGHDLQVVYRSVDVKVGSFDLTMMTSSEVEETIGAFLEQERSKPFVFHEAPLWRATVFELKQHNIYVFQFHHAILDGWSVASLNTELYQLCTEIHAGRPLPVVPPLKSSYRDYIIESIATKRNTATHAFWKQELAAYKRLDIFTEETCQERFSRRYADTFLYKLREKAGRENISLKAIFFGAYLYSLSALTYENDVTIGLVTNSRPLSEDGDRLIGCFLNTVPFRFTMVNSSTWQSYFEEIERKLLRLKEVDRTSLLTIAEITREQGNAGNPFFDALFNFVNFHVYGKLGESGAGENEEDNIALSGHELTNTFLDCTVNLTGGVFAVSYSLRKKLRSEKTLEQLEEYFSNALLFYLEQPDRKISDCPVLPAAEHYPLLRTFAGESVHYPEDKTVLDLFEEKAVLAPEATALVCDNERWSYKTLDEQSNRLAHYLKASGTVPEDLIVVCIGRRPEMLVAMLGILKAGAAYVPVDPGYPQDRIQYILNDCKCRQVIALTSTADFFAENDMNVICLDAPSDVLLQHPVHAVNDRPAVTQLAYIIYTSGSTGRPKGVMIEHRNLVNLVHWHIDSHEVLPESRATAMASVGFDAFGWEVWPYLCAGSSLWLLDDQIKTAPQRLAAFYANEQITHSFIATGLVEDVLDALRHRTTDLQYLLTGGDRLQRVDTTGLSFVLSNNYGPTENTVVTTSYFLGEEADETLPPIGRAVSNTNTYVLNANLDLAPVGVPGELCVGGAQLARGYLNLPELTAEKFVPHPFIKGARLYRTGDLVRRRGDGNIEFIDRLDDQVKIRGYRIELGEIENILKQAPGIRQCAVTARHDNRGIKYLAGYVVTEHDFDKAATEAWLKQQLPAYMIPAAWVVLEELPLTVNGKVDRKALPDADPAALKTTAYTAPRNETEATLAAIWQQLLRIERIGIYDNFFELGGHSLLALRLLAAIRKELTAELEMKALFRYPTIAALSESGELKGGHVLLPAITAGTRPLQLPLSFSQERLWFIDRLEGTLHYHIPLVLRMKGPLNETALHHALQTIVERHEVLRTVYRQEEETVCQVIRDAAQWTFTALDTATDLKTAVASFIATPFDLSADYMLRAAVSTVSTEEHLLVICLHHIAADGWSAEVIVREFTSLYSAYLHNTPVALPPLPVQYADFAIWQRNYVNDGVLQQQQSYWMKQLAGVETLNLPADYARPAIQSIRGAMFHTTIDADLTDALHKLSNKLEATSFMTLLAAFKVLLYRYSGQHDIAIGTPVAGRRQQEVNDLIGFFVNTLVIRTYPEAGQPFADYLQHVKSSFLEAYDHQDIPFERVVNAVVRERDRSRHPLFQVMFVMEHAPDTDSKELEGLQISAEEATHDTVQFDLTFTIAEHKDGMSLAVSYCTDLFTAATIQRMTAHYVQLLRAVAAAAAAADNIDALEMLLPGEARQLLDASGDIPVGFPADKTIVDLFEEQAARTPDAIAAVSGAERLTYKALQQRSNQLAHFLVSKGVKPETLVPVCTARTLDMIVGILGILKAGGAYVPIDTLYPADRILYMLQDTAATVVVCDTEGRNAVQQTGYDTSLADLSSDWNAISQLPASIPAVKISPANAAYVIYTSGSTGRPKGVVVEHFNVVRLFMTDQPLFDFNEQDVWSVFHSFCFDFSVWEMYGALFYGGRLVVIPKEVAQDAAAFGELLLTEGITVLNQTPSSFYVLQDYLAERTTVMPVRYVIFGGEALNPVKIKSWKQSYPGCRLINMYGITETTVHVTFKELQPEHLNSNISVIGNPIPTLSAYILDSRRQPVPVGVPGELYIGGAGVARGYLNLPVLTAEKFIEHPFIGGKRLYRSGDLARRMPDGDIEYLGRIDEQVKIRGFRIELGEIESVLQQTGMVSQCVVLAKADARGDKRLVAYVVPKDNFDKDDAIVLLKERLPEYMVPAAWVLLEEVPLTSNGKVNRKALPEPDSFPVNNREYVAPVTGTEILLAEIWKELLGLSAVSIHDNFFEAGGHSLLVTRLTALIRKRRTAEISVKEVFEYPTIALLSKHLDHAAKAALPAVLPQERPARIPLSYSQERLWFIDQLEGSTQFHIPLVLKLEGRLNAAALENALRTVVDRHEVLRTVIREENGTGYQEILSANDWKLAGIASADVHAFIAQPFHLATDYMLRAGIIRNSATAHLLVLTVHHIAADGWSLSVIGHELSAFYAAYTDGATALPEPLSIQYADFALWQREYLTGDVMASQQAFWKQQLSGVEPLRLPADLSAQVNDETPGDILTFSLDKSLGAALNRFSQQQGATLFMTLLAVFEILLQRYSGQEDICVGTVIAGRRQQELEGLIGFFINTLAIRSDLDKQHTFTALVQKVKARLLNVYDNQDLPFEKVIETAASSSRALGSNPFFQVMFLMENAPESSSFRFGALQVSPVESSYTAAQFDLIFTVAEEAGNLSLSIGYSTGLFRKETIVRMAGHYEQLLKAAMAAPEEHIYQLPLLSVAEQETLSRFSAGPASAYPHEKSVITLFEEQVQQRPDAIALAYDDQTMTYRELDAASGQLAHLLQQRGVQADTLVGICIGKGLEMIMGILAVWKAGGAYVPFDPAYPVERMRYMLDDTGTAIVLSSNESKNNLPSDWEGLVINLDDRAAFGDMPVTALAHKPSGRDLSYVIYTSGSTGKPKGVLVEHQGMLNHLYAKINDLQLDASSILAYTASYTFDISVWQMFCALLCGGKTVIYGDHHILQPAELIRQVDTDEVTILELVPSYLNAVLQEELSVSLSRLRYLLVTGEAVSPALVTAWFNHPQYQRIPVVNAYGPTEASDDITHHFMYAAPTGNSVPLGRPVQHLHIYILDNHGQQCAPGIAGEICVSGIGVSRGYLNRPDLTADRFVQDPYRNGERMYRTGDLGRWLDDGAIEYLGRIDEQVKIRGYRIELGEIENMLQQHESVQQCAVVASANEQGIRHLVAYVVPNDAVSKTALHQYLGERLPEYMVPGVWMMLEQLPLTPNGKIDRKNLPDPEIIHTQSGGYVAPRNETEQALAAVWQQLLGIERIGIYDNFFELGGHSLIAIRVLTAIRKMGYSIQLSDLVIHKTIAELSAMLTETDTRNQEDYSGGHILSLNKATTGRPVFIMPGGIGPAEGYDRLAKALEACGPVYGLSMMGTQEKEAPLGAIEEIATRNIEWMRLMQPVGPYRLIGHSFGGWVVHEMVKQLEHNGDSVQFAAIMDVSPRTEMPSTVSALMDIAKGTLEMLGIIETTDRCPAWLTDIETAMTRLPPEDTRRFMIDEVISHCRAMNRFPETELRLGRLLLFNSTMFSYVSAGKVNAAFTIVHADTVKWQQDGFDETLGWTTFTSQVQTITAPGDHFNMIDGANGDTLGSLLKAQLESTDITSTHIR